LDNSSKIILDLCGGTGSWSKPYKDAGYDVRVITLPEYDLQDERTVEYCISLKPYGILFAVDCTVWANCGACWFKGRTSDEIFYYSKLLVKGLRIIYATNPSFYCIENPVGKMSQFLGVPNFKFDPFEFAGYSVNPESEAYTKRTYLWGRFTPPPKNPVVCLFKSNGNSPNAWYNKVGGKSQKTKERRSKTPSGFAKAFFQANQ